MMSFFLVRPQRGPFWSVGIYSVLCVSWTPTIKFNFFFQPDVAAVNEVFSRFLQQLSSLPKILLVLGWSLWRKLWSGDDDWLLAYGGPQRLKLIICYWDFFSISDQKKVHVSSWQTWQLIITSILLIFLIKKWWNWPPITNNDQIYLW